MFGERCCYYPLRNKLKDVKVRRQPTIKLNTVSRETTLWKPTHTSQASSVDQPPSQLPPVKRCFVCTSDSHNLTSCDRFLQMTSTLRAVAAREAKGLFTLPLPIVSCLFATSSVVPFVSIQLVSIESAHGAVACKFTYKIRSLV